MPDTPIDWDRVGEKQRKMLARYWEWHEAIKLIDKRAATENCKLFFSTPMWDIAPSWIKVVKLQMDREVLGSTDEINGQIERIINTEHSFSG